MPALSDHTFALTKWYFDCVADDGRVAIGYCAGLTSPRLSLTWQALTVWKDDRRTFERSSLATSSMPSRTNNQITWTAPALGCSIEAHTNQPAAALRLLQTATGFVDWRCEAPLARVVIQTAGSTPLQGLGYVECLEMTIPPWQLPIRELRWGRWADSECAHSIVWIDWRAETPRTWGLIDGVSAPVLDVRDDRVDLQSSTLTLTRASTLSSRALEDVLTRIPPLHTIVPRSLLQLREEKWVSRGTWRRPGEADTAGLAIHERVVFR